MNQMLKGKKLLILGAYRSEIDIIEEAKKQGIYTIVTDNHTDWTEAPAKYEADEAWNISWSDMETLRAKCIERGVDGCMAGFSERRVGCAQELCRIMGFPFYTDGADLETIFNKRKFKDACRKCGINVPKDYKFGDKIDYPVIVKPADNGGSRGITICYNDVDLETAYTKALKMSDSGEVVIEEYIATDEIMIYFTIHDEEIELSAMCDRYMKRFDDNITQLPVGYYYPSKYLNLFQEHVDNFKKLIKYLKIRNGLLAFQSFVRGVDIIPFDPTFRLDGTMAYHIISKINGCNVLKMLIHHALTGSMGGLMKIKSMETPYFDKIGFELPVLLKNGWITKIAGLNDIRKLDRIIFIFQNLSKGEYMEKSADFSQIMCRIHICAENDEELRDTVRQINRYLQVIDENGCDMIIGRISSEEIGD